MHCQRLLRSSCILHTAAALPTAAHRRSSSLRPLRRSPRQVIAEHLFHEGQFEIGDAFVGEAGLGDGEALKRPYASMHTVLQQVGGPGRAGGCWAVG